MPNARDSLSWPCRSGSRLRPAYRELVSVPPGHCLVEHAGPFRPAQVPGLGGRLMLCRWLLGATIALLPAMPVVDDAEDEMQEPERQRPLYDVGEEDLLPISGAGHQEPQQHWKEAGTDPSGRQPALPAKGSSLRNICVTAQGNAGAQNPIGKIRAAVFLPGAWPSSQSVQDVEGQEP